MIGCPKVIRWVLTNQSTYFQCILYIDIYESMSKIHILYYCIWILQYSVHCDGSGSKWQYWSEYFTPKKCYKCNTKMINFSSNYRLQINCYYIKKKIFYELLVRFRFKHSWIKIPGSTVVGWMQLLQIKCRIQIGKTDFFSRPSNGRQIFVQLFCKIS